jgi:CBS domain-containing protein
MRPAPLSLPAAATIATARDRARRQSLGLVAVHDERGFRQLLALADLETAADGGLGERPVTALIDAVSSAASEDNAESHLHPDHPLSLALERLGASHHRFLPVVSRANVRKLVGIVTVDDILACYGVAPREWPPEPPTAEARGR